MAGAKLKDLGFTEEILPKHWAIKESVFPFSRFPGSPIVLTPEMRSTGEVMGQDEDFGMAFANTQMAAKPSLPLEGNVFLSVKDSDKPQALEIAKGLHDLGFSFTRPKEPLSFSTKTASRRRPSCASAKAGPTSPT